MMGWLKSLRTKLPWRTGAKYLAASLMLAGVLFLASWTRFPNILFGCVDHVERLLLSLAEYAGARTASDKLRIIQINEEAPGHPFHFGDRTARLRWRRYRAELLGRLAEAQAWVVAFDFSFGDDSPFDAEFAAAIGEAAPTQVVVGFEEEEDTGGSKISSVLATALDSEGLGSLNVGGVRKELGNEYLRYVLLGEATAVVLIAGREASVTPTFPLQVKLAWERRSRGKKITAWLDVASEELVLRGDGDYLERIPCRIKQANGNPSRLQAYAMVRMLHRSETEKIARPYSLVHSWIKDTPQNFARFQDKLVLVVPLLEEDKPIPALDIYGHEIIASQITSLLDGGHMRELGKTAQCFLLFALCAVSGMVRRAVPKGDRTMKIPFKLPIIGTGLTLPITLVGVLVLYLVVFALLFTSLHLFLDGAYHVVGLTAGYYLNGWPLLRWAPGPTQPKSKGKDRQVQ